MVQISTGGESGYGRQILRGKFTSSSGSIIITICYISVQIKPSIRRFILKIQHFIITDIVWHPVLIQQIRPIIRMGIACAAGKEHLMLSYRNQIGGLHLKAVGNIEIIGMVNGIHYIKHGNPEAGCRISAFIKLDL